VVEEKRKMENLEKAKETNYEVAVEEEEDYKDQILVLSR
jgi:hypothetical protein